MVNEEKYLDYLRKATADLRQTRRRLHEVEAKDHEPIAIVAMSCRFPGGVRSPEDLWQLVADGGDAVGEFPADRGWGLAAEPDPAEMSVVRRGGFLDEPGQFDAGFFGMSPREALATDPQQRLLLETSWDACERAGIDPASLKGSRTGVFVGAASSSYGAGVTRFPDGLGGLMLTGNALSVASGRISYTLGLEGPAVTVDTACSSSLVALHLAVQSLRRGECTLALAGGAAVMFTPGMFQEFGRQRALAADGRCKAFAAAADGTGWAEGVGLLLVERLSDARSNGHPVLAVVRGTAVNQDGASNGLTAPNGPSQQRVIRAALANARLTAEQVDLVEAHGTGTTLGDPIEAQALINTYGREHTPERPLWLGSLKSNIGHAQSAAGVGGVIKAVMAIRHGLLPKTLHVDAPSPHIDWSAGAVALLTDTRPWPETGEPRRAGVSSFGLSGTNAHAILEQAPEPEAVAEPENGVQPEPVLRTAGLLPWSLSARTADALRAQAEQLRAHLAEHPDLDPADTALSLVGTRAVFEHRAVLLADRREDFLKGLDALASGTSVNGLVRGVAGSRGRLAFVFPGQGAQWVGMGVELLDASPVFADRMAECAAALAPFVDWDLLEVLRGDGAELERVDVVQPVLFAVMVSLAEVWRSFGVQPAAVAGHSQGEIAAACVAGALSLADAARVVALRSKALQAIAGRGGMVSVALPQDGVRELLTPGLSIAAINGPATVVVSGDTGELDQLLARCEADGVRARRIWVDYASHSAHVEALEAALLDALRPVTPCAAQVPFYSTVTGGLLDTEQLDAAYWYRNLRSTVQLGAAVSQLISSGHTRLVEVSPHPVLTMALQESLDAADLPAEQPSCVVGTLRRDDGGARRVLTSVAELHTGGGAVDWRGLFTGTPAQPVELPTYPFQRQRYWLQDVPATEADEVRLEPVGDTRFWDAVERADLTTLAGALELTETEALGGLLPALTSYRARSRSWSETERWRYRVSWRPLDLAGVPELPGRWIVALPETVPDGLSELVAEFERRGAVLVSGGPAAVREALDDATTGVLSLLALDERPHSEHPQLSAGFAATLALAGAGLPVPVWCVTRGAVSTGRSDRLAAPVQAMAWGLGRVAALETPRSWGGLIDLPEQVDRRAVARLLAVLAAGVESARSEDARTEDQVAVRGSGVFGRRLVRADSGQLVDWRPRGTVLVTGGTGGLGAQVARWLAGSGAERLVLTSRRGPAAPGAAELAQELRALGAEVAIEACDLADRAAVADLLDRWPVSAVVHAAGVTLAAPLARTGLAEAAQVIAGKAVGAAHLDELLGDRQLDAFVVFSSISGVWGGGDQGAYAAGNAFLDALVQARRARGLAGTAVAWGPWAEVGMATRDGAGEQLARRGLPAMAPESAIAALQQALAAGEETLTVVDVDWARFAPAFTLTRPSALLGDLPEVRRALEQAAPAADPADTGARLRRELAPLAEAEREHRLLELVRSHAAAVLGHASAAELEPGRAFRELGFDSLTAVDLRNRLTAETGLRLPATLVFDYPTPTVVARHLRDELLGAAVSAGNHMPVAAVAAIDDEPIAIVAMSCRLPGGVRSPEELWRLVVAGGDAIGGFPADRGWNLAELYDPDPEHPGTSYAREGGFLYDASLFDPGFFGMSPREALATDPQQRLLLETAWEAFERAGIRADTVKGEQIGVFVGAGASGYGTSLASVPEGVEGYLLTGNASSVASGRLAYTFGLEGPAVTVDTACSSSLVALHLAVQSLRRGECGMALAAGVAVMSTPMAFVEFSRQGGLSSDGRCKAFAAAADGTGWAEGAGVLLLERLSDAERHGHPVLAVVRGTAVNQDGASNGLTAPNGPSQQRVIRAALANAGLTADQVDAVEAHGTGTRLGDPIEAQALLATYGQNRPAERPLWLGTLKSNLGHTQAASGIAGVIKTVLAIEHGVLPQTLHVDELTPQVDWSAGEVRLLAEAVDWPESGRPRRAGVSSFGVSGTNAHAIIEQAPAVLDAPATPTREVTPLVVSGRSAAALRAQADLLRELFDGKTSLADGGFSLAAGRAVFEHRAVALEPEALAALALGDEAPGLVRGVAAAGRTAFLFTGQGAQRPGMGRDLYAAFPVFAEAFDAVCARMDAELERPLREVVFGDSEVIHQTAYTQPALFALEVALYRLLESFGLMPDALIGHSVGEIAAAHVAGVFSLDDACRLVASRGRLMQQLPPGGAMVAVAATEAEILEYGLDEGVAIAAVNGPRSVVLSGDEGGVLELAAHWEGLGRKTRRLRVSHAFHSPAMDGMLAEFAEVVRGLDLAAPSLALVSNLSGRLATAEELRDPDYWVRHVREAVRFHDGVQALEAAGVTRFLELGPDGVLTALTEDGLSTAPSVVTTALRKDRSEPTAFFSALAELYVDGATVDWTRAFPGAHRIDLPTYPFQRERYWLEAPESEARPADVAGVDTEFWELVDRADAAELSNSLQLDADRPLSELLPALAAYRHRRREQNELDSCRYQIDWAALPEPATTALHGTWALVLDQAAAADPAVTAIEAGLVRHGAHVVRLVLPADAERAGLTALLRTELADADLNGIAALVGWEDGAAPEQAARSLTLTITMLQALGDAGLAAPYWAVTRGAVSTGHADRSADPGQAALWGLGRVAALELPSSWGGSVDLPPTLDERAASRLVAVLAGGAEDQVAVRGAGLLGRRLARATTGPKAQAWHPSGTVLVTGGTGALGAEVARWLAANGAERLVLAGRRGLAAPGAAELLSELSATGTEVLVETVDVTERQALADLLSRIPVTAVVHTAGVLEDGVLDGLTPERVSTVLRPKVDGAWNLHELTRELELDAFVLFSSLAGTTGGAGQASYAAANAYLDALAEHRHGLGLPATAIAWGPWAGAGMAADHTVADRLRRGGLRPMAPERALAALGAALGHGDVTVAVADLDWSHFAPAHCKDRPGRLLDTLPEARRALEGAGREQTADGPSDAPSLRTKLAGLPPADQLRLLTDLVRTKVATVLGHRTAEAVDSRRAFRELGFDSLTAVELRNRLAAATEVRLPATLVFDHPTPAELARRLHTELAPGGVPAGTALLGELDRLDTALAALDAEDPDRAQIATRLQTLLLKCGGSRSETATNAVANQIQSASSDEIFDFIDKELGFS
ncbi:acyl transferase domain-containing protein/acyl carrier protein [Kitasatospora sp. GP30]|uniref:type I polyketide synthase n=1 Tax=Kitasatospora sp. GP30 TaxID=3035084 RepID=UPI000CBDFA22|nr:type I polyketide synthase [Kitasatospora sp. GP30]MDH6142632.1 acyl transferase domain-containing protein/acyl carrier protein [Kitasatospora sp. GP30]